MKRCPTCQQTFPDTVGDICPNDAASLAYVSETGNPYDNQPRWQQPPAGWATPPQGQFNYKPSLGVGSSSLSTTALICGICATFFPLMAYALASSARDYATIKLAVILMYLTIIMGLTAINLGIVAASLANGDSARKTKGIIGLCLGILPFFIFMMLGLSFNGPGRLF
ncbi:MAG TPA: hypothetical protein VF779_12200 [Pyrinomonadaceae bacterium]